MTDIQLTDTKTQRQRLRKKRSNNNKTITNPYGQWGDDNGPTQPQRWLKLRQLYQACKNIVYNTPKNSSRMDVQLEHTCVLSSEVKNDLQRRLVEAEQEAAPAAAAAADDDEKMDFEAIERQLRVLEECDDGSDDVFDRCARLKLVREDLEEIGELFRAVGQLAAANSLQLQSIEERIDDAHAKLQVADADLKKAQRSSTVVVLTGGALGACIAGPIGMFVGMKVAAATAVVGAVCGAKLASHR